MTNFVDKVKLNINKMATSNDAVNNRDVVTYCVERGRTLCQTIKVFKSSYMHNSSFKCRYVSDLCVSQPDERSESSFKKSRPT